MPVSAELALNNYVLVLCNCPTLDIPQKFELVRVFLCLAHASSLTFQSVLTLREGVTSLQLAMKYTHTVSELSLSYSTIQPQRLQKSELSTAQTSRGELELRRLQFPRTMHGGEGVICCVRASTVLQEQYHPPVYR